MKTTLLVLGLICFARTAPAQAPGLNLYPNASIAQCPNVGVTYTIVPWVPACHTLDTVMGGDVVNQEFQNGRLKVTIVWQEPVDSLPGHLAVLRADSACEYAPPGQGWDVTIIPTLATKPVISGESAYFDMGRYNFITLRTSLDLGVPGLTPTLFEWQAPAGGWIFSTYGSLDHASTSLRISPTDTLEQGCVRVRGKYPCGAWSDWTDYCLQGAIPNACPITLASPHLLCGDTAEHVVFAPVVGLPALPQYIWAPIRYVWTTPPGWQVLSANPNPQSSARVRPDGHTSGLISLVVTTSAFTSAPCEYAATFLPAHPSTAVIGPDFVCTAGEFRISPLPPPQSEISWQVTPVDPATPQAVFPNHGSGMASLQISDPAVSGDFRITYHIFPWSPNGHHLDTVIGGEVISQGFYDGKMKIVIVWQKPVDSMPGLIAVRRSDSNCDFLPPGRDWMVPVITPLNTVPVVTGANEYYLGESGLRNRFGGDQFGRSRYGGL